MSTILFFWCQLVSATHSPSPKHRVTKVMVANLTNKWDKMWSIEVKKSSVKNESIFKFIQYLFLYQYQHAVLIESESTDLFVCCILVGHLK